MSFVWPCGKLIFFPLSAKHGHQHLQWGKKTSVEETAGRQRVKACNAPWSGMMVRRHQELGWLEILLSLFFHSWGAPRRKARDLITQKHHRQDGWNVLGMYLQGLRHADHAELVEN